MTKNVDPNEAWPELDRLIIENLDEDRRTISDLRSLKSDLYAFANRLHEAGELERELVGLPGIRLETWHTGHVVIKYYLANGVPSKLERKGLVIKIEAETPLQAVRALRKKLEEEKLL